MILFYFILHRCDPLSMRCYIKKLPLIPTISIYLFLSTDMIQYPHIKMTRLILGWWYINCMENIYLTGTGNNWWRQRVREEVRSCSLSQKRDQLFGPCGVASSCPTQCFAQCAVDDVHLTWLETKVFLCSPEDSNAINLHVLYVNQHFKSIYQIEQFKWTYYLPYLPVFPKKPVAWHSSINTMALYFSARAHISGRGATLPSILNTPSVTMSFIRASLTSCSLVSRSWKDNKYNHNKSISPVAMKLWC